MKHMFVVMTCVMLLMTGLTVHAQNTQTLTVFAASSLTNAFDEIGTAFETTNPTVEVVFNYASSSDLAQQLVAGAPVDVFASANNKQLQVVQDAGRIVGKSVTFAKNRLVLLVPSDNPAQIATLADLAKTGVKLVIAANGVPVRDYTDTLVNRLVNDAGLGETYRTAFMANVVSEEQNVRQVATKVSLGEADAGIVYVSDVTPDIADQVLAIQIPDYLNTIATYPIAVTNDSANPEWAQAFVDFVRSDAGQDILVKWNFISVRIPPVAYEVVLPTDTTHVVVDGQVLNPFTLSLDDLRTNFVPQIQTVTYLSGDDTVSATFIGIPLWQIVSAAQPNTNADVKNDRLSLFIVVTGSDGYQAVIAWGEIDPEFGAQPILLAYEQDGAPISDAHGGFRLVVPNDARGGRYVSGVVNITVRDAPQVAK